MNFDIPPIIIYLGSWSGSIISLLTIFGGADKVVIKESKKNFSKWLKNYDIKNIHKWAPYIIDGFDAIFGKKHLTFRCFFISSLASLVFVFIIALLYLSQEVTLIKELSKSNLTWVLPVILLLIASIFNFLPDYLSLLETRYVLSRMLRVNKNFKLILWMIADVAITAGILLITCLLISIIMIFHGVSPENILKGAISLFLQGITFSHGEIIVVDNPINPYSVETGIPLGIFFYSTFLTSIWIWLFYISGILSKFTYKFSKLRNHLDLENHPFKSIGIVAMVIVTVLYIIIPIARVFV